MFPWFDRTDSNHHTLSSQYEQLVTEIGDGVDSYDFIAMFLIQFHGANTTRSTVCLSISVSLLLHIASSQIDDGLTVFIHDWMHLTVSKATPLGHSKLRKGQNMCIFIRRSNHPDNTVAIFELHTADTCSDTALDLDGESD